MHRDGATRAPAVHGPWVVLAAPILAARKDTFALACHEPHPACLVARQAWKGAWILRRGAVGCMDLNNRTGSSLFR